MVVVVVVVPYRRLQVLTTRYVCMYVSLVRSSEGVLDLSERASERAGESLCVSSQVMRCRDGQ